MIGRERSIPKSWPASSRIKGLEMVPTEQWGSPEQLWVRIMCQCTSTLHRNADIPKVPFSLYKGKWLANTYFLFGLFINRMRNSSFLSLRHCMCKKQGKIFFLEHLQFPFFSFLFSAAVFQPAVELMRSVEGLWEGRFSENQAHFYGSWMIQNWVLHNSSGISCNTSNKSVK